MSIDPDTVERIQKNDRVIVKWLLVAVITVVAIAASFAVWRTHIARDRWFEFAAQMDKQGVEVDAIVVARHCGSRSVKYAWKWNSQDYSGEGWPCNSVCADTKLGTEVRVRFLPASPTSVECLPRDISRIIGPPSYWDTLLLVLFLIAGLFVPVIQYRK
jgi:hypothetical protein